MASVSASIETPNGDNINIALYDNGLGSDSVKNDGIYTAYFTDYKTVGRYNVLVSAVNDGNAKLRTKSFRRYKNSFAENRNTTHSRNKTNTIDNFKQVLFFSNNNLNLKTIHEFSRVQNAGAFRLLRSPNIDNIPPNRVTDLSIASIDEFSHTVDLQWTSAGDDLTTGTAQQIVIRADYDLNKFHSDTEFDNLYELTNKQVIDS
jgi:calcium-activated chloride channel regulator 1/calcium-activated chloride channel regulator 2/calcium-activated chloride channel regulator 4